MSEVSLVLYLLFFDAGVGEGWGGVGWVWGEGLGVSYI